MDALAGLLDGPRARQAFLLRAVLDPPWSLRILDRAPLAVFAVTRGAAWVLPETGEPLRVAAGDVVVARGPDSYVVADDPATEPQVLVYPHGRCVSLYGEELMDTMSLGVRTWGNSRDGGTVMLIGTYEGRGEVSDRLLRALPALLVVRGDSWHSPLVPLLADEIGRDEQGQSAILDRLLDLVLIAVLRQWFAREADAAPGWYRAYADPVVGRALRLLHDNPALPWTVADLAAKVGVSRAALARRFTDLVDEAPMAYLTGWRLALAADLLRAPDATIAAVARQVGYGSAFALSAAFKRVRGMSPQAYRRAAAAAEELPGQEVVPDPHPPAEHGEPPVGRQPRSSSNRSAKVLQ